MFHWKREVIDSSELFLSAKYRKSTCHKSCYNKELLCSIIVNAVVVFSVFTVCQNLTKEMYLLFVCGSVCECVFDARHHLFSVSERETKAHLNQPVCCWFSFNYDNCAESTHQSTETIWFLHFEHKPAFNLFTCRSRWISGRHIIYSSKWLHSSNIICLWVLWSLSMGTWENNLNKDFLQTFCF